MNVDIWNKKDESWNTIKNVKRIYVSASGYYFKLDGATYKTSEYTLGFIFDSKLYEEGA